MACLSIWYTDICFKQGNNVSVYVVYKTEGSLKVESLLWEFETQTHEKIHQVIAKKIINKTEV